MRMPSLIKYFAVVGSMLLGVLFLINQLAAPVAGEGKTQAAVPAPKIAVQNDPQASAVERWRNQIAAMREAEQAQTADNASMAVKSAPEPAGSVQTVAAAVRPVPVETPRSISEAAAALTSPSAGVPVQVQDEASTAKVAAEKARTAKMKAAKVKLTRDRAAAARMAAGDGGVPVAGQYGTTRERSASNLQDQYYYGQRSASAQPAPSQGYAYAPQRNYGPFGGFGRGW